MTRCRYHRTTVPPEARALFAATLLATILLAPTLSAGEHRPPTPSGVTEIGGHARLFLRDPRFDPMLSLDWRFEDEAFEFRRRSLTAGTYYRIHDNVKIGGFYRLQAGMRHDDDWVSTDGGGFEWEDTRERWEHLLIADISPRFLFDFLPGEDWVFQWKNRYHYNFFNGHQTLQTRPTLTYFLIRDREPLWNFGAGWDLSIPLNFGDSFIYRSYPYLHALYHASRSVKLDAALALESVTWSTSRDVADAPSHDDYTTTYRPVVFTLGGIFSVDL